MDIAELLTFSVKNGASDLHLSAGLPPMIRVDGDMRKVNVPALDHKTVHGLVYDIMTSSARIMRNSWRRISRSRSPISPVSVSMHLTRIVVQVPFSGQFPLKFLPLRTLVHRESSRKFRIHREAWYW